MADILSNTLFAQENEEIIKDFGGELKNLSKEIDKGDSSYLLEVSTLLKVKAFIRNDYYKFLTAEDFKKIDKKLESKKKEVMECLSKYKELNEPKPKFLPFFMGYLGYNVCSNKNDYLSVVDYSMGAESNRLFLINMKTNKVEINTTCMQGKGRNGVQTFSNQAESWQSSIGLMQISSEKDPRNKRTYGGVQPYKEKDKKLIVYGKEKGFNDNVWERYIYMHTGFDSKGCFTLSQDEIGYAVLDKMAFGGVIMSFYPDMSYIENTELLS